MSDLLKKPLLPLSQTHRQSPEEVFPLGGSRHVWWQEARDLATPKSAALVKASALPPEAREAFSAPRAALCGLSLDRPRIMGILNTTPDSFSDGGSYTDFTSAIAHAKALLDHAELLDIGGESTRPGAAEVTVEEEIRRTAPLIRALRAEGITAPISIDTRKAAVAEAALDAGADIVNDVTAMRFDAKMAALVAERGAPVCLMHSVADPATMQSHAHYRDVLTEVYDHLLERIEAADRAGIAMDKIITDPGIGFAKNTSHNLELIAGLAAFHGLGLPILLGVSRKRFIGELTGATEARDRVTGSVTVALCGAAAGAQILRVHDAKETRQALSIWQAMAGTSEELGNVA